MNIDSWCHIDVQRLVVVIHARVDDISLHVFETTRPPVLVSLPQFDRFSNAADDAELSAGVVVMVVEVVKRAGCGAFHFRIIDVVLEAHDGSLRIGMGQKQYAYEREETHDVLMYMLYVIIKQPAGESNSHFLIQSQTC